MPTIEFSSLADRKLRGLVDTRAAAEAAAALHAIAAGARILMAADDILHGGDGIARDRLRDAITSTEFEPLLRQWMREMREAASAWPDSGACTVATALRLWSWTLNHLRSAKPAAVEELAEALCPLLAARCYVLQSVTEGAELQLDLSHVYAAHVSALAGAACAELVFGYRQHLKWDAEGCAICFGSGDLDELEALFPGFASGGRTSIDVIEGDGSHPAKRGPCVRFDGVEAFTRLRNRLDGCLSGARIAKERAAAAIGRK